MTVEPSPPAPKDADDLALELPPSDGGTDEGAHEDTDEAAFDEDTADGDENETIGLDVSVGFDQETDLADLIANVGAEDQPWTEGAEGADSVNDEIKLDARDLSDEGEEDGWTDDNEAAGDSVAHHDDALDDGTLPQLGGDSGEGFDEEPSFGDIDEADLPPMDAGEGDFDHADGMLDSSLLGQIDEMATPEADRIEVAPGVRWAAFPRARIQVSTLHAPDALELFHAGVAVWARTQRSLINLDSTQPESVTPPTGVTQVLVDPADGSITVSGERGLFAVHADAEAENLGGPSADPAMIANATLAVTHERGQSQRWAQTRLGTLFAMKTQPARWSLCDSPRPGRHLASDGRRALAYIHAAPNRPCGLVVSQDAGASWSTRTIAVSDATLVERLLVCRDVVVLVCDSMTAPVLVSVGDEEPTQLLDGLRSPVTVLVEDSEVVLYGCVVTSEHVLLIRQPLGNPRRPPSVIERLPVGAAHGGRLLPSAIVASYRAGYTDLLLTVAPGEAQRFKLEIARDSSE